MKKILFLLLSIVVLGACNKDDNASTTAADQLITDIEKIQDYLTENSLNAEYTETGIYFIIEEEGNDVYPNLNSIVKVEYVGRLLSNGQMFDSGTINQPPFTETNVAVPLSGFIEGWQEGLQLFSEGASGKLFIPSGLAYGPDDYYTIPGNSVLMFDITLISVTDSE